VTTNSKGCWEDREDELKNRAPETSIYLGIRKMKRSWKKISRRSSQ
jgi:hypothetical protein